MSTTETCIQWNQAVEDEFKNIFDIDLKKWTT